MGVLRKYSASAVLINKECPNVRPFQGWKHMKSQHVATHKNDSGLLGFHQCSKPLVYSSTGASIKILKIERKDTWSHLRQLMTQYIICYWYISFKFVLVLLDDFIISLISGLAISGHVQILWSERNLQCSLDQYIVSEMICYRISSKHIKFHAFITKDGW